MADMIGNVAWTFLSSQPHRLVNDGFRAIRLKVFVSATCLLLMVVVTSGSFLVLRPEETKRLLRFLNYLLQTSH